MPLRRPRSALLAAALLAGLVACHDAAGPNAERLSAVEIVVPDTAPIGLRLLAPNGASRARLGLDRMVPIPSEPGGLSGAPFSATTTGHLDFVRWSPDGRAAAAIAVRSDEQAAAVLVLDVAGDSVRAASIVGQSLAGLDWSPDGRRLAYATGVPRGRSATYGVGTTDVGTWQSRRLFLADTLGWESGRIPEAVRWSAAGDEIYFAVWRRNPDDEAPGHEVSILYAIDATTRRLRVVRDSVAGRVAELSRAGDFVLLLRTPPDDPAPSWPYDHRRLVRLDLATGRETVLVDHAVIRAARLTHRDDHVIVTLHPGSVGDYPGRIQLVTDLYTVAGGGLGTVARSLVPEIHLLVWGTRPVDVRVP